MARQSHAIRLVRDAASARCGSSAWPRGQLLDRRAQLGTLRGQRVGDANRGAGLDLALDHALFLQLAQALREQRSESPGTALASSPKRSGRSVSAQRIAPVQRLPISSIAA